MKTRRPSNFCKALTGNAGLCIILAAAFILSACSTVKVANIEKRRYRDGYYVQMKHRTQEKQEFAVRNIEVKQKLKYTTPDKPANVAVPGRLNKEDIGEIRSSLRALRKGHLPERLTSFSRAGNLNRFMAVMNESAEKGMFLDSRRNSASSPINHTRTDLEKTSETKGAGPFGTGISALILLIIFLIVFIILLPIGLAIFMAFLFALVIVWLLKQLNIID